MFEDVLAAIPWGLLMAFMIGPVFFVLLETSALRGFRAAIVFDLGVIFADILFILAAYFSSFKLLENLSNQPGLYIFGGTILIVYGVVTFLNRGFREPTAKARAQKGNYLRLFVKGFLLNFINIGVLVFWLGLVIVIGPNVNNDPKRIMVFFGSMIGTFFFVDIFKILLAKGLKQKLTPTRIGLVKKVLGVVLAICGLVLILKGFLPKEQFPIDKGIRQIEGMQ